MFAKNLAAFILGLACQVLAGVYPHLAGALIGPASLLLSASDIRAVLDGSFIKHLTILLLAIGCQVAAVACPASWNAAQPLLAAGGLLMAASDIKRVLKGREPVTAPIVTPDPIPPKPLFPPAGPLGPIGGTTDDHSAKG